MADFASEQPPVRMVTVPLGDTGSSLIFVPRHPSPSAQHLLEGWNVSIASAQKHLPYGRLHLARFEVLFGLRRGSINQSFRLSVAELGFAMHGPHQQCGHTAFGYLQTMLAVKPVWILDSKFGFAATEEFALTWLARDGTIEFQSELDNVLR